MGKEGHLSYKIENGEVTITECDKSASGELAISDTIEGYPVTSIVLCAFGGCTDLTSITIPGSVTSIGDLAFEGCSSLTSIKIPDSVALIEFRTFLDCTGLTSITIGKSVTCIHMYAFEGCTSLTNITIPDSVSDIVFGAFSGCTSLASITFEENAPGVNESVEGYDEHGRPLYYHGAFDGVTATAYYPAGNDTWTKFPKLGYGGHITWVPYERPTD